jgi:hypothetical protein
MNAKIYQGAAETALASLTEMSNVRDVTLTLEAGEADVTTRANQGWRATAATLRECTVEFEMLWLPSDAGFQAIRDAYLNSTKVCLAVLTGANDAAGSEGPHGDFAISSFSRKEPLEEGVSVSVTAKLAKYTAWVEVAA